jgi:P27 family predicted phage terminase small subunit
MGRFPKPEALRQLTGSKHRRRADEPKPEGVVRIPRGLSTQARRHWKRLAGILQPMGLLSVADADAFRSLVETLAIIDKARLELGKSGLVVMIRGKPSMNPFLRVLRDSENQARLLFAEFGLTPASRTRLYTSPAPPSPSLDNSDLSESYFADGPEPALQ